MKAEQGRGRNSWEFIFGSTGRKQKAYWGRESFETSNPVPTDTSSIKATPPNPF